MFGHSSRRRERKALKKERTAFEAEKNAYNAQEPQREMEREESVRNQIRRDTEEAKRARQEAREEGRKYAQDVLSQDLKGLTPAQRNAMQYEANKSIQRSQQSANRRLLGDQGRRGIVGKGGVGYAQQRDLERIGQEARGQAARDLDRLDTDLALKKIGASFAIEQGEAAQNQLDRQLAADELRLNEERKRQRGYEDKFNRLFSRI